MVPKEFIKSESINRINVPQTIYKKGKNEAPNKTAKNIYKMKINTDKLNALVFLFSIFHFSF
jgi:hypothetical protein